MFFAASIMQAYEAVDALSQEIASLQTEHHALKQLHEDAQQALEALAAEVEDISSAKQEATEQLNQVQLQLEEANKQVRVDCGYGTASDFRSAGGLHLLSPFSKVVASWVVQALGSSVMDHSAALSGVWNKRS
jgi:hypothetical protein